MRKKRKSDKYTTLILIILLLVGVSLMLYPTFSEQWNALQQGQLIDGYNNHVQTMDDDKYNLVWAQAREYNQKLRTRSDPFSLTDTLAEEYEQCLNVYENGVMGYLEIPSIDCSLAIYHSVDEAVLLTNVGHIEWSSLPIGGESSHSVLSGHTGLPSAELLTNIDRLDIGDVFYLHILDEKLTYVVDNISVVLPHETQSLKIVEGKDYVTLQTCTPYGVNSHRLLVRGERVNVATNETVNVFIANEVSEMSKVLTIAASAIFLAVGFAAIYFPIKYAVKLRCRKEAAKNESEKVN